MICKNEADGVAACLASLRSHISHWTVLDTGSTDGTQQIVRDALRGIPGQLVEEPFANFGASRSRSFELAVGTADWLVATDADMTWEFDDGWEPSQSVDALMVSMGSVDFQYRLPLVIAGSHLWRSVGACHEYTCLPDRAYVSAVTDKVRVTTHGDRSSPEKSRWHLSLLEAEMAADPDNSRAVFYAANTLRDLGDPRAIAMYEKRMKMGGWAEEVFYSKYRRALLLPTWPAQVMALIEAWESRPQRLEPVYELVKGLNYRGQHHAALGFARTPVEPTADNLFVHASVWRWGMDFERSIAEWHAGDRAECRRISERLLTIDIPQNVRAAVERNLTFC